MMTFKTLKEAAEFIRKHNWGEGEQYIENMRWNNDAGDWDLEDIEIASDQYFSDFKIQNYAVSYIDNNIYDGGGNILFQRIEEV